MNELRRARWQGLDGRLVLPAPRRRLALSDPTQSTANELAEPPAAEPSSATPPRRLELPPEGEDS